MKIGIKIFPDNEAILRKIIDHIDFVEIMTVRGIDFTPFKSYDIPYVIHSEHFGWKINLVNKDRWKENVSSLRFSIQIADMLNAKFIITHPELKENENCSIENIAKILKTVNDNRILTENMTPRCYGFENFGYTPKEMKKILKLANISFCLDLSHAGITAKSLKIDIIEFLKEFMKLEPVYMHISDFKCDPDAKDFLGADHFHLGEGELNLEALKPLIPKNSMIAIETWHNIEKKMNDINIMKTFK